MQQKTLRRILSLFLALMFVMLSSLGNMFVHAGDGTQTGYEYEEDFESGQAVDSDVPWTPRNSGNTSTTLKIAADMQMVETNNQILQVNQPSTVSSSQWFTNVFASEGLQGKFEVTFDIKASDAINTFFFLTDGANSKSIIQLCIRDNGYFCLDTGDGLPWNHKVTETFEKDKWYAVKIIVDTEAKTIAVSVDGGTEASYSFRETATNLGALRFGCGSGTKDNAAIDNIVVKDYAEADEDATVYYSEDFQTGFEAGSTVDWTPRNSGNATTTLTIAKDLQMADTGNRILQVNQPSTVGSSQWFTNVFNSEGLQGKYEVTFDIKASDAVNSFFFLTDAANSKSIIQLCIRDNEYFCLDTADGTPWNHKITETFERNKWYAVKIVLDTDAQSFVISVDGGTEYTYAFREAAANLGALRIGCGSSTKDNVSIDNIVIKNCDALKNINTTFAQKSADGKDLRIITEFTQDVYDNLANIEAMGVKISKNGGAEVDFATEYVTANTNFGISESDYSGAFASVITNYDTTATYKVTPYYTVGGETVVGETVTINSTVIQ